MSWFERVPKVELHLHLKGAIPLEALWELVQKYGGGASVADLAALERRFQYRDFPHFIDTWMWKNELLRELGVSDSTTRSRGQAVLVLTGGHAGGHHCRP